jgi:hypothetical protein
MPNLGPNHRIVEQFFKALSSQGEEQWERIRQLVALNATTFVGWGWEELRKTVEAHYGRDSQERSLNAIAERALRTSRGGIGTEAMYAAMALGYAHVVDDTYQFTAAYGAFAAAIPQSSIDADGILPNVLEVPNETWRRFLWRAYGLTRWDEPVTLARVLQAALGTAPVDAALDIAFNSLNEGNDSDTLATAVVQSQEFIEHIGIDQIERSAELYRAMAGRIGNKEWAEARSDWDSNELVAFHAVCARAVQALIFRDRLAESDFWLLYLPFATTIPAHSLEVGARRRF